MSQRVKLRSQKAEPRVTESSGLGPPLREQHRAVIQNWSLESAACAWLDFRLLWSSDYDMLPCPPIFQWEFFVIILCYVTKTRRNLVGVSG